MRAETSADMKSSLQRCRANNDLLYSGKADYVRHPIAFLSGTGRLKYGTVPRSGPRSADRLTGRSVADGLGVA